MREDFGEIIVIEDAALAGGFTAFPNVVLYEPSISHGAKLAFCFLLDYAWRHKRFPGQSVLAGHMGVSTRWARKYLKELEDTHMISVERLGLGRTNRYIIHSLSERVISDRNYSSGQGGSTVPTKPEPNLRSSVNETSTENLNDEDDSASFFSQIGDRYGHGKRDQQSLSTALSKYPEETVRWAVEALENGLARVKNPAAWLNAVVPRLAEALQERKREQLTQRQEQLVMIRATAHFYRQVDEPARVRDRLIEDFGDVELVEEALGS